MTWLTDLINNTKQLTALQRFNFITKEDYILLSNVVTNFQDNRQENVYIEAVILLAEYTAVARNFKEAYDYVQPLKTLVLTALQQAHVERIIGSYLGKEVYDQYGAGVVSLTTAAQLFAQQQDWQWQFNTLMNLIGVYSRHAHDIDQTTMENLYQEIRSLNQYDDCDHHGTYVAAFWMANYYFCVHNFQQAETVFRHAAGYQDNQHLQKMRLVSKFEELQQKIEQQRKNLNGHLVKISMWQPAKLPEQADELLVEQEGLVPASN